MNTPSHYDTLEVLPTASPEVIKGAYKHLAQRWHPDRNSGREEQARRRMAQINEAYRVLSDPAQRQAYDATLNAVRAQQAHTQASAQQAYTQASAQQAPQPQPARPQRPQDWDAVVRERQEAERFRERQWHAHAMARVATQSQPRRAAAAPAPKPAAVRPGSPGWDPFEWMAASVEPEGLAVVVFFILLFLPKL